MVFFNIWLLIEVLNILVLRKQIAVLCIFFSSLQDFYMILGQRDLLKYRIKVLELSWECLYLIPSKLVYASTPSCLSSQYSAILKSAYFTLRNIFSCISAYSTECWNKSSSKSISLLSCTILIWFASSFSLSTHWFKSVVSYYYVETEFFSISHNWNSNTANLVKSISIRTENSNFCCTYNGKVTQLWQTITTKFICLTPKS